MPDSVDARPALLTIGQLARRTGLPVRTIRFWSDEGVVPPAGRTSAGYRLYDPQAAARLELVRTLRELGVDLDTIRAVLDAELPLAEVARTHLAELDADIRRLRVLRAVLATFAREGGDADRLRLLHQLAQLTAGQRRRLVDAFVTQVFEGLPLAGPSGQIAGRMRQLPAGEPTAEPTAEQAVAWVELTALVLDPGFQARVREMAVAGADGGDPPPDLPGALGPVGEAVAAGVAPGSDAARRVLERVLGPDGLGVPPAERPALLARMETFSDPRVTRYWRLMALVNDCPAPPGLADLIARVEWFLAASRAASGHGLSGRRGRP